MRHFPGITISENKIFVNALKLFKSSWKFKVIEPKYFYCYRIARLVELMCLTLTIEEEDIEQLANKYDIMILGDEIEHAYELYGKVYDNLNQISFTDMVFQPAIRNIKMPKYDFVLVDEIQDLNLAQQRIIQKIIKPNIGRLIGVGDPAQAIYGFAGADFESYSKLKQIVPNTKEMPLNICYRCPAKVIELAQTLVPQITGRLGVKQGEVIYEGTFDMIGDHDYVICRNTKPLVDLFKVLIKKGKKANIKGREVGDNIITLIKKTKATTLDALDTAIVLQVGDLRTKLIKKGYPKVDSHPQMLKLQEKRDIIKILSEDVKTIDQLAKRITDIFLDKDFPGIVLSTIHRVKGLEADTIFFLNSHLIPSQYAKTKEELQQEKNLMYVALTRAKSKLVYLQI
jgi:ATP-dependent exoDNAse (exonuclease V) beta subunit